MQFIQAVAYIILVAKSFFSECLTYHTWWEWCRFDLFNRTFLYLINKMKLKYIIISCRSMERNQCQNLILIPIMCEEDLTSFFCSSNAILIAAIVTSWLRAGDGYCFWGKFSIFMTNFYQANALQYISVMYFFQKYLKSALNNESLLHLENRHVA